MQLSVEDIQCVIKLLCHSNISLEQAERLRVAHPNSEDLLYYLLSERKSQPLSAAVSALLSKFVPPVSRHVFQSHSPSKHLRIAKMSLQQSLRLKLFDAQKELAELLGSTKDLEEQIYRLKDQINSLSISEPDSDS